MKHIVTLLSIVFMSLALHAGPVERYFQHHQQQQSQFLLKASTIETAYFDQRIDSDHPESGTFKQRYYIDETYAKDANSPVFFYICGEATCHQSALLGAIRTYAKQFNARLVALEHRFYGKSQPFNDLTTKHLRYLTIKNALADLAHFQRTMAAEKGWHGKWVSFGGSYPGSLSAYYRMQYPDLVVGAVASSAPVRAQESFPEYDKHVTKVAGPACANAIRRVVQKIEAAQANRQTFAEIKHLFSADEVRDDVDFLYLVADIGAGAIQYGMHDEFCKMLAGPNGELNGYAEFAHTLYERFDETAVNMTVQVAETDALDTNAQGVGIRQWYYQSCLEYGYWQVAYEDLNQSTRSTQIDLNYHHNICQRLFQMDMPVDIGKTNDAFFTPLLHDATSHIIFTNGSNDPWSVLSLTPDSPWATNSSLIYELIEGYAHCNDLRSPAKSDSPALLAARKRVTAAIGHWLS